MRISTLDSLEKVKEMGLRLLYPEKRKISVGMATCGIATGAAKVMDALEKEIRGKDVILARTGCIGFCQKEPIVESFEPGKPIIIYKEMTPEKAVQLLDGKIRKEWALCKIGEGEVDGIPPMEEVDFYRKQMKLITRNCGLTDPESLEEYVALGGYFSLFKVLSEKEPGKVIEEIRKSGLRGRGGAGFPTGAKWRFCRDASGDKKYVICNADEGDPGAYQDRTLLEGDPFSVLEGMTIGAYCVGADEGYIYVRNEYPLAIEKFGKAIESARSYGLLGKNIMDFGFDFDVQIKRGGGAFVCGEETALIASIEGRTGEPRQRPPFPAQVGVFGKPTLINNVKTFASIPIIIGRGTDWYSRIGTERSKGTMIFSIVGKVENTGLAEVPMGITLRDMIYVIGGGVPNGKRFKAVQTGGPSGGVIPERLLDLPIDYETLESTGSIMGSGGMIVMDETVCMVDIAKYFLNFITEESCGKCTTCREGVKRMLEILTDISEGRAKEEDIGLLEELATVISDASMCALGKTAPNPVLTTLRYFRDEYGEHIKRRCPARVCKALITYTIDPEKCTGCGICAGVCPENAIVGEKGKPHSILKEKCVKCGACFDACKLGAVVVE